MENLTQALYMALAAAVFIIAFSFSLYMVDKLKVTSDAVTYTLDKTNYYDTFSFNNLKVDPITGNDIISNRSRIVGIDTIIPTLYRYYKESFAVRIVDVDGSLIQYFDTTSEYDVNSASARKGLSSSLPEEQRNKDAAILALYDNSTKQYYMFGAPWGSDDEKLKTRIDMFIKGESGYINNTWVDYSGVNLNNYNNRRFKEIFSQYAYEGDTVTDENDELIALTGTKQISTKIVITYQLLSL